MKGIFAHFLGSISVAGAFGKCNLCTRRSSMREVISFVFSLKIPIRLNTLTALCFLIGQNADLAICTLP